MDFPLLKLKSSLALASLARLFELEIVVANHLMDLTKAVSTKTIALVITIHNHLVAARDHQSRVEHLRAAAIRHQSLHAQRAFQENLDPTQEIAMEAIAIIQV